MLAAGHLLERVIVYSAFGVRFWDEVSQRAVDDGLVVTASPALAPERRVRATPNRSGVVAFHHLPDLGLSPFERGVAANPYRIEVRDETERFLPFQFSVRPSSGLLVTRLETEFGSPLSFSPGVPLFSSPARPVSSGTAVVRAELRDVTVPGTAATAAAFAVLTVTIPPPPFDVGLPTIARGVADERGQVAVVFPYPGFVESPLGSPLGSPLSAANLPLDEQTWPVQLSVAYAPPDDATGLMDLSRTLAQPTAAVAVDSEPMGSSVSGTLAYGRGLVDAGGRPLTPILSVRSSSPL